MSKAAGFGVQIGDMDLKEGLAWVSLVWWGFITSVAALGTATAVRNYHKKNNRVFTIEEERKGLPFVSILRPIKGLDPHLETTISSVFYITYPKDKYEILLCLPSEEEPALPLLREILKRHPEVNARILVGEEDVGPNPKIRNMSRGYREAKGDIMWILDSNVWVTEGILERSVQTLQGKDGALGYKLVHHLPLCIDAPEENEEALSLRKSFGGRLEETFMSTSHAKFYIAINTVAVAPCLVGKSNLFRKSHLAEVTPSCPGINYFAHNICEDHLIGDILWKTPLQSEIKGDEKWRKHGLAQDVVLQPISGMKTSQYLARRTRWLRVRKWTVLAATLVEPTTESIVSSLMGAYAFTTLYPHLIPTINSSLSPFFTFCIIQLSAWCIVDRFLSSFLHSYLTQEPTKNTPEFVTKKTARRGFGTWVRQWIGREMFAFPIWFWAMMPGTVKWRGSRYYVGMDMKVKALDKGKAPKVVQVDGNETSTEVSYADSN